MDEEECYAASLLSADECARSGLERAPFDTFTIMSESDPVGVFGVTPFEGDVGIPWMLVTNRFMEVRHDFKRQCRPWVDHFQRIYPHLINFVSEENTIAIRWLKWCGFTFGETVELGPEATPFIRFERNK